MDLSAAMASVNWLSVSLAALSAFMIGGLWYGPVFGRAWMTQWGFSEQDLLGRSMPQVFGGALVLSFLAALCLELFVGPQAEPATGALAGFLAGAGWVSTFLGILYLFEMRSLKLYFINAGYCTLSLAVMGVVLGAM